MPPPITIKVTQTHLTYEKRTRRGTEVVTEPRLVVESPYHPDFVTGVKAIGGKWNGTVWHCHPDAQDILSELLIEVYGTDGSSPPPLVNVIATYTGDQPHSHELYLCGKEVFHKGSIARGGDVSLIRTGQGGPLSVAIYNVPLVLAQRNELEPPDGWMISRPDTDATPSAPAVDAVAPVWDRVLPLSWDDKAALVRRILDWLAAHADEHAGDLRMGVRVDELLNELQRQLREMTA